jgi:hypothetical protein
LRSGDWVNTPEGVGVLEAITDDGKNAYVAIGRSMYGFALNLVTPVNKAVEDILIAVHNQKEK